MIKTIIMLAIWKEYNCRNDNQAYLMGVDM